MVPSPYRRPATRPDKHSEEPSEALDDAALLPVLGILWLSSVIRVFQGIWRAEPLSDELTLASAAVLLLPFFLVACVAPWIRGRRADRERD